MLFCVCALLVVCGSLYCASAALQSVRAVDVEARAVLARVGR